MTRRRLSSASDDLNSADRKGAEAGAFFADGFGGSAAEHAIKERPCRSR